MKINFSKKITNWLFYALTISCLFTGQVSTAHAQSTGGAKVGDDVRQKANSSSSVDVLIQPVGTWSSALDSAVASSSGSVKRSFNNFTARAVTLPSAALNGLANRPDVAFISLDNNIQVLGHVSLTSGADAARAMGGSSAYDGTGIGIAILDSGIAPNHVAFSSLNGSGSRIQVNMDFTGENRTDDPYGHGTHIASIAAGNGAVSSGAYIGIAPNANLINLRVLNSQGQGTTSGLLSALDWLMTNHTAYNIRVVNMSLGGAAINSYKNDPLCQAVRRLVNAGVVVVAAAGNDGKDSNNNKIYGAIHSPGNEPSAITVGAANTFGTDERSDDGVTTYSSRGPTRSYYTDASSVKHYDNLVKPDLIAPGNKIIDAQSPGNYLVTTYTALDANVSNSVNKDQMYLSGTSMATPVVAGAAALLLQANPSLTPNLVKSILMYTSQQLHYFNTFEQGAGEVNIEGAMRLAKLVRTDLSSTTPVGDPLLCMTCTAPVPQTTIGNYTFGWGQGLVMDYTFATGLNLLTKYQKIYGLGVLMGDGTTVNSSGVLMSDGVMMSDGVLMSDHIMTSTGVLMSDGYPFISCGVLMSDGVLMADGVLMSDGTLKSDGVLMSDGLLTSSGVLVSNGTTQAQNAVINGDPTQTMPALPDSPANLTGTGASISQINLTWADGSNNESGFRVERCQGAGCTNFVEVGNVAANTMSLSNTGLLTNATYIYRVRAYIQGGNSAYSNTVQVATLPSAPTAPSTLAAKAVSASQISLTWADNATNEDGFLIERSTDGVSFTQIATVVANTKTYSSTGLLAVKKYYYRVRAYNKGGNSGYSNSAYATTSR
ncbi:MAG: S8 family serine peptidase [Acidobacteria bacterium]|nr:S8 family serine peptidase [Acidobacteriota bacterium]